jgi:hypothetical protein
MAERARRLAGEGYDDLTRNRLERAAEEYDQRAREIEMEDTTGQWDAIIEDRLDPAAGCCAVRKR